MLVSFILALGPTPARADAIPRLIQLVLGSEWRRARSQPSRPGYLPPPDLPTCPTPPWHAVQPRQHRLAADAHAADSTAFDADRNMHLTGASHLHALQAQHRAGLVRRHHLMPHEIATERAARTAGRRILRDPELRREHPAVNGRAVAARLRREQEHAVRHAFRSAQERLERAGVADGVVDGAAGRERDEQEGHAARHDLNRQPRGGDRRRRKRKRRGRCGLVAQRLAEHRVGCVIHANGRSSPFHERLTGTGPMPSPNTHRSIPWRTPARARANVAPIVGCPAAGSSLPGVKIRILTSVPVTSGGKMNVDSEKFISLAIACIVSVGSPRPSRNTASWLPPNR